MNRIMNLSGKFLTPVSRYTAENNADSAPESMPEPPASLFETDDVVIPECPACKPTLMELVRHYFGSLWWLWLIVVILIISKEGE